MWICVASGPETYNILGNNILGWFLLGKIVVNRTLRSMKIVLHLSIGVETGAEEIGDAQKQESPYDHIILHRT